MVRYTADGGGLVTQQPWFCNGILGAGLNVRVNGAHDPEKWYRFSEKIMRRQ